MTTFVRFVALLLGLAVGAAPVLLALFVASVEPQRPASWSWFGPFLAAGIVSSVGCFCIVLAPARVAASASELRLLVGLLVVCPVGVVAYLLARSGNPLMVVLSATALAGVALLCSACVWPSWLRRHDPLVPQDANAL